MPRSHKRLATGSLPALVFSASLANAQEPADPFEGSSLRDIITAIRDLESTSDAKCQATATRLENFMYGTPLTEQARFEKIRLQKELIGGLWRRAPRTAASLEIVWPNGERQSVPDLAANGAYVIEQGAEPPSLRAATD